MSVLKNKRSESTIEFYHNATVIRAEITRYVMNEKHVPKRWRPVFTFPMIEKLIAMMDNIVAANTIFPTCKEDVKLRASYQQQAIICVEQIFEQMQYMIQTLKLYEESLQPIVEMLQREMQLLRGWNRSDKERYKDLV